MESSNALRSPTFLDLEFRLHAVGLARAFFCYGYGYWPVVACCTAAFYPPGPRSM